MSRAGRLYLWYVDVGGLDWIPESYSIQTWMIEKERMLQLGASEAGVFPRPRMEERKEGVIFKNETHK